MASIYAKLMAVQSKLHAPKGQRNDFGKYNYRSAEDILQAVKPLLEDNGLVLVLSDTIECINDFNYIKACAVLVDVETSEKIEASAYAKEELAKKGMDTSQITGSCSSYARKYALNGLFAIDNTKDSDATNTGEIMMITAEQVDILKGLGVDFAGLCKVCKVTKIEDLTYDNAEWAIKKKRGQ